MVPNPPLSREQLKKGRAADQAPTAGAKRLVNGARGFARRLGNRTRANVRPGSGPLVKGVSPGEKLRFRKRRRCSRVAHAASLCEQACQRRPTRQPAHPNPERLIDLAPRLVGRAENGTGENLRPRAGPPMVLVGPRDDLVHGQMRHARCSPNRSAGPQQSPERRAAGEPTGSLPQRSAPRRPRSSRGRPGQRPNRGSAISPRARAMRRPSRGSARR